MAVDRSQQELVLYKKDGTVVATGAVGTKAVTLTGLAPGTHVNAGDYQVAFSDGANTSAKVDVPAFDVLENIGNEQTGS